MHFLIPLLIGTGCLIFTTNLLFQAVSYSRKQAQSCDNNHSKNITERENIAEKDIFLKDKTALAHDTAPMDMRRKIMYALLFGGLGIGSILFAFVEIHPDFKYAAKAIIFLTFITSILIGNRPQKQKPEKPEDHSLKNNDE
ncbi:MAG: hypothetical protein CMH27_06590 [Micavibrio sp.]|nr:hypothetical protein [Micavibrio sp.]|tara:strand:- start:1300 stop:1722 length:423 start_codon:yes stop_codon:yes gene_type:complete